MVTVLSSLIIKRAKERRCAYIRKLLSFKVKSQNYNHINNITDLIFFSLTADPVEWTLGQVQKWLLWTEHLYRLPQVGKAFLHLSGSDLCVMSEDDFRQRCSPCGEVLFAHLDIWKTGSTFHSDFIQIDVHKVFINSL